MVEEYKTDGADRLCSNIFALVLGWLGMRATRYLILFI